MRHLKAFHVFHIAASSKSYSEAAIRLNITHGAVSKQIKQLESYLAKPLFYREGRHVFLTLEGELLKQYTTQAFGALNEGMSALSKLGTNHLDVSCEPTLTMRWLMPRLSAFNSEQQVDVRLSTAGGAVNLGENGLSMAIRRDDFELQDDYQVTPLVAEWVGPVCSPDYWQSIRKDLSKMRLLHSQTRPQAWSDWLKNQGSHYVVETQQIAACHAKSQFQHAYHLAHFYFCLQAAQDGLGMAIGSYPLVQDELLRGQLIAPFQFIESGHQYILLSQKKMNNPLEQIFKNWLIAEIENSVPCLTLVNDH